MSWMLKKFIWQDRLVFTLLMLLLPANSLLEPAVDCGSISNKYRNAEAYQKLFDQWKSHALDNSLKERGRITLICLRRKGVASGESAVLDWLQIPSELGVTEAQLQFSLITIINQLDESKSPPLESTNQAINWLIDMAIADNAEAIFLLGLFLRESVDDASTKSIGFKFIERAFVSGSIEAKDYLERFKK